MTANEAKSTREAFRREYDFRESLMTLAGSVFYGTKATSEEVFAFVNGIHRMQQDYEDRCRSEQKILTE